MRKVSSEAASISCIYFQQKISKNQEIRNWITVLQYQKKKKKKTPKKQKKTPSQSNGKEDGKKRTESHVIKAEERE